MDVLKLLGLARTPSAPKPQPAACPVPAAPAAAMARDQVAVAPNAWTPGRPLSEARNAHSTNTKEHFAEALKSDANWFEGDIRTEINPPHALEMRHDPGHESGDNLTLEEWLAKGKASGRGLKLDVKEGDRLADILATVEKSGVPHGRLMFNLGERDMAKWGAEIRRRFPEATLAFNPSATAGPALDLTLRQAQALGGPVTFVYRFDLIMDKPDAIKQIQAVGPISVWNAMDGVSVSDAGKTADEVRRRGIAGVVDIRETPDLGEKLGIAVDKGKNLVRDAWDKLF